MFGSTFGVWCVSKTNSLNPTITPDIDMLSPPTSQLSRSLKYFTCFQKDLTKLMSKGVLCMYSFFQMHVHKNIVCKFIIKYPSGPSNEFIH